ncbi:MAG: hypothetical protein IPM21_13365 [Acidobacteria bacterium]|nr:hypothetical protein [Acidobacteriota bacterium]
MHRSIFLLFAVLVVSSLAVKAQEKERKTTTAKGTVIAYSTSYALIPCYHVCNLTILVKTVNLRDAPYVIVNVRHMDDRNLEKQGLHSELIKKSNRWQFTGSIGENRTVVLEEYLKIANVSGNVDKGVKIKAWTFLEGSAQYDLPFGQYVPNYDVEIGRFRKIK